MLHPTYRNLTGAVLFGLLLGLLCWDIVLALDEHPQNTISEVVSDYPAVAMIFAYLLGHGWPMQKVLAAIWKRELVTLNADQLAEVKTEVDRLTQR